MNDNVRDEAIKGSPERRAEILGAAFDLLVEHGYRGTSTLAIAKRARTSKETIYNWFGSKEGLFRELIGFRTAPANLDLTRNIAITGAPVEEVLARLGATLLEMLLSEQVIAVSRAAIAEARTQPELARLLQERGRSDTGGPIGAYLGRKVADGTLAIVDLPRAVEVFISLLSSGVQWRRLLDLEPPPDPAFVERRAREAAGLFLRLYAAPPR